MNKHRYICIQNDEIRLSFGCVRFLKKRIFILQGFARCIIIYYK